MGKLIPVEKATWYRDAVIYEAAVRSFKDSNADGIGDFRGLIEKLDYLEELGITAIWLLPFYPSPLKDDGYDISDYYGIHRDYGRLKDFTDFLGESHRRGIRVITEIVLNHTSNQHPWFRLARSAPKGSRRRRRYIWSDSPEKYPEARVIFSDFETSNWAWDPEAGAYFWHRFYSHQPDLNYDNPEVRAEMRRVIDFWLGLGVDGLRLDAVPYLFEREGTNCENLPETHAFLRELRAHIDDKFGDRMLLAEANQWPEDAAAYFGEGDECHLAFHFPLMPRIFMSLKMEDSFPIMDILNSTPAIPAGCQWATFLRNHDELTLEMVTDQERDYMYRAYARDPRSKINLGIRRRLAPLLDNDRRKIELVNILILSLPGTPVIYYGDEIGMGDNYHLGDRNGVRTPMQWSSDRNAGFSRCNPQQLYLPVIIDPEYHYETVNVENQGKNLSSLLWWMRRVIAMRRRLISFGRGTFSLVGSSSPRVLAFIREFFGEEVLVVVNLSRFSQAVRLGLSAYSGRIPEEVFSRNFFPRIGRRPYALTLGPFGHYWLKLHQESIPEETAVSAPGSLRTQGPWTELLEPDRRNPLTEELLPAYLTGRRWFGAKSRRLSRVRVAESVSFRSGGAHARLLLVEAAFRDGLPEFYFLPVSFAPAAKIPPQAVIARLEAAGEEGVIFDSAYDPAFRDALLEMIARRGKIKGKTGEIVAVRGRHYRRLAGAGATAPVSFLLDAEQSNTSFRYGDRFFLKLYRRPGEGINPEAETLKFLTESTRFGRVPPYAGALEFRRYGDGPPITLALLEGAIESHEDPGAMTREVLLRYFEQVLARRSELPADPRRAGGELLSHLLDSPFPDAVALLGRRTGQLHRALGSRSEIEEFAPEPFTRLYQRALYQSMQALVARTLDNLKRLLGGLPVGFLPGARAVIESRRGILARMRRLTEKKLEAKKIRVHGDYHLGQVLYTGRDFFIIDFEGEPGRPISERRLKHSPLKDVAGMLRSFHYDACGCLYLDSPFRPEDIPLLEGWIDPWYDFVSDLFLKAYREEMAGSGLLPDSDEDFRILLEAFLLEKSVYELGYELDNRPGWLSIPLRGILGLLGARTGKTRRRAGVPTAGKTTEDTAHG